MIDFFEQELVLTETAFQGETGFAVQGVGELHEGGAGHVCHSGQVSEGGDQVGKFSKASKAGRIKSEISLTKLIVK